MQSYISICLFLITTFFLAPFAKAQSAKSFNIKIIDSNFSSEDSSLINLIKTAWDKKCKDKDPSLNCMLQERDVFTNSINPDHLLLFRGELYTRPVGLSAFAAFAQKYPAVCDSQPCTEQNLIHSLLRILKKMPSEAPGAFCNSNFGSFIFNIEVDRWFETARRDNCQANPVALLEKKHITGTNDIKIQKGNDTFPLDPFISLSQDPNIGLKFAKFHEDKSGRLLIISIDQKRIPNVSTRLSEEEYEQESRFQFENYFRFSETLNFAIEREVSAFIAIPTRDIKLIINPVR